MVRSSLLLLGCIGLTFACSSAPKHTPFSLKTAPPIVVDADTTRLYKKALPSIVIVESYKDGSISGRGAAVCVTFKGQPRLITAAHCVPTGHTFKLKYSDGSEHVPYTTVRNESRDLAVITVSKYPSEGLPLAKTNPLVGTDVWAIGHPFGEFNYITGPGLVSQYDAKTGQLLISVPVAPGNSGGPALNAKGEVVGICQSMKYIEWDQFNKFAPASWVQDLYK